MTRLDSLLGSRIVSNTASRLTRGRLRVLAFHDIDDPVSFGHLLDVIDSRFNTVTGSDVSAWIYEGVELPEDPLWITFDDGYTSVVSTGLELLAARNLRATLFVCAGLVGTDEAYWWEIVEQAVDHGLVRATDVGADADDDATVSKQGAMAFLKRCPDPVRRSRVAEFTERLAAVAAPDGRQISRSELGRWIDAGNEVGNHSWDHPCLDRCDPAEQGRQVRQSHEVLTAIFGRQPDVFAWPNGNPADAARRALTELGYRLVLGFDHRLLPRRPNPLALSRLRVDCSTDPTRLDAILSGAHSTAYHLTRRARRIDNLADAR